MNIIKRVFKLYDRIERLEKMVVRLDAELKAEKAVAKINEQALVSCERQLGMDEKAPILPSESVEDGQPTLKCYTCRDAVHCDNADKLGMAAVCKDGSKYRGKYPMKEK
jgi:hypothetical protein